MFSKVPLGIETLTHERLTTWYVAFGLDPPPARDFPSALRYAMLDFIEHGGLVFLHPFIESRGRGGEVEIVVFTHESQHGRKGGLGLLEPLLPPPEPYRVKMRIADHVQCLCLRVVPGIHDVTLPLAL